MDSSLDLHASFDLSVRVESDGCETMAATDVEH
jgi:hypothetical protein